MRRSAANSCSCAAPRASASILTGCSGAGSLRLGVYGIKVVAIDPINELTLRPPPSQCKTDYLGDFIMDLKDLGEDYGLLTIVVGCTRPRTQRSGGSRATAS